MITKKFLLSTLGYTATTFILAVIWHIGLFADLYEKIGYIGREEPGFLLGLFSIVTQGLVLSYLYPRVQHGVYLIAAIGIYHWSMHVVAAAAKNQINEVPLFFGIETVYLVIQFVLAALIFTIVYSK